MTVTEKKKYINKEVYNYLEENGFTYEYEEGGRLSVWKDKEWTYSEDIFEYHLGRHDVGCFDWSSEECIDEVKKLEVFIDNLLLNK